MNKRRLGFILGLGLILAIFVSACGVALGPVQFTSSGQGGLSPVLTGLHLPAIHQPSVLHSMHELQRFQTSTAQYLFEDGVVSCHSLH